MNSQEYENASAYLEKQWRHVQRGEPRGKRVIRAIQAPATTKTTLAIMMPTRKNMLNEAEVVVVTVGWWSWY